MGSNLFNLLSAILIAVLAVVGPALIAYGVIHWIITNKSERSQQIVFSTVAILLALSSMIASTLALVPSIQSGLNQLFATSTPSGLPVSTPTDKVQSSQTTTLPTPTMTVNSQSQPINTLHTATPELSPTPPRREEKGISFVQIPAGNFTFEGENANDGFWIGEYEVTNSEFAQFLNSRNPSNICGDNQSCINDNVQDTRISNISGSWAVQVGYESHPVVWVSWRAASEFCKWLGGDLPTRAEWVKAGYWDPKTLQRLQYPWGNEAPTSEKANYNGSETVNVGSFPSGLSPSGVYDMAGNVWEFVNTVQGQNRFWLGGGWDSPPSSLDVYVLEFGTVDGSRNKNLGFRCVK